MASELIIIALCVILAIALIAQVALILRVGRPTKTNRDDPRLHNMYLDLVARFVSEGMWLQDAKARAAAIIETEAFTPMED